MATAIIVMGAAGRMGSTLVRLVRAAEDLQLKAMLEHGDRLHELGNLNANLNANLDDCLRGQNLAEILPLCPRAVLVDFTSPQASLATARAAAGSGNPVVIGTTGFTPEQRAELEELAEHSPLFWSPNMSVGVNVMLRLLPELARMLGEDYDMDIVELHHNAKKDAPSGTALRLGEALAGARGWTLPESACYHREGLVGARPRKEIGIQTVRGGDIVGVHTVYFMGAGERLEFTHQAHSRENFAQGALRAARWLAGQKPGRLYDMQDVLRA